MKIYKIFFCLLFVFFYLSSFSQNYKFSKDTIIDASNKTKADSKNDLMVSALNAEFCKNSLFIIDGKKQNRLKENCKFLYQKKYEVFKFLKKREEISKITLDSSVIQIFYLRTKK